MNRRRLLHITLVMAFMVFTFPTSGLGENAAFTSSEITPENVSQVCRLLTDAGLANIDVFERWVESYVSADAEDAGFNDADCRMTVMLLTGDMIRYDSVEREYTGDYLMFDVNLIENNEEYSMLRDKEQLFTTMFGEMPIPESGFADALSEQWGRHGIRIESDRYSVISILFKAWEREEAFVGHTGILIDCRNQPGTDGNYVFVEKLAFRDPFMITVLKDENDLLNLFSGRSDYVMEEGDLFPVVYRNGEKMGTLRESLPETIAENESAIHQEAL